jgi:hypothetical protein
MCNLRWANERGLTLKAKPKIKVKYWHIYFLVYLPSPTYLNIDLNVFWPKLNLHAMWQMFLLCHMAWSNTIQNRWWKSNMQF